MHAIIHAIFRTISIQSPDHDTQALERAPVFCCVRVFFNTVRAALRVSIEAGQTKGLILRQDVRGVYSHPPATGGIRLGGVVAADVRDAIRIDDLRGIKIPYYDGNPCNLDDFILDWEDFAEEVVGEMKGAPK